MTYFLDIAATVFSTILVFAGLRADGWERPSMALIIFLVMANMVYLVLRLWGLL